MWTEIGGCERKGSAPVKEEGGGHKSQISDMGKSDEL